MSKWTKMTYEMVAGVLRRTHGETVSNKIADEFAKIFRQDNPRFDSVRFLDACGVKP